jgi:protein pelota
MKIIFKDLQHGEIKIKPQILDDIWHLYHIIQKGDLVKAITYRTTDDLNSDKIRSKKSIKKKIKLGIRVEEVKFHEFSDRLRIHGIIEEGIQDKGSYHTFNVTADDKDPLIIIKDKWKDYEIQRLEEAVRDTKQPLIVFVSLDDDTATIAVLRQSGIQLIADIQSHRSGKMYDSPSVEKEYFGEIISMIKHNKPDDAPLIVVGPGFSKDHFTLYGRTTAPQLFQQCYNGNTSNAGMNGIQEAMKLGLIDHIAKENRVAFETKLLEILFVEIRKDGLATYGEKEVRTALESGAVDYLLISDTVIRSEKGDNLMNLANSHQSKFTIINSIHEAGKKLDGIGGIAALLRFKI